MKKCPHCGGENQDEASDCQYCQESFDLEKAAPIKPPRIRRVENLSPQTIQIPKVQRIKSPPPQPIKAQKKKSITAKQFILISLLIIGFCCLVSTLSKQGDQTASSPIIVIPTQTVEYVEVVEATNTAILSTKIMPPTWTPGISPVPTDIILDEQLKTSGCNSNGPYPDPLCTPGAIFPVEANQICVSGYSQSVRDVSESTKNQVYAAYGITSHAPGEYEIDHFIPLELGGSNEITNLFPEAANPKPGFHEKDKVENYLHDQVCSGAISLQMAQDIIKEDWVKVYGALASAQLPTLQNTIPNPTKQIYIPLPTSPPGRTCCKVCTTGKPCGDSCISKNYTCHKAPGCAC